MVNPGIITNKTGKGGFKDHPENRANGKWSAENSFTYCMNMFKKMTIVELEDWNKNTPKTVRTVAQDLAFRRIIGATSKLDEFREVANRTEGMPKQSTDLTSNGKTLTGLIQINEND